MKAAPLLLTVLASPLGCAAEFTLRDLRCEVEAGEVVRVPAAPAETASADAGVREVWQEQIQLRNNTTLTLRDVVVVLNPEALDPENTSGYRFRMPEPLEPGGRPRFALGVFRNRDGKNFPVGEVDIVQVRVETALGSKTFPGTTNRKRFNQLDFLNSIQP
jgi:hypothetical protein